MCFYFWFKLLADYIWDLIRIGNFDGELSIKPDTGLSKNDILTAVGYVLQKKSFDARDSANADRVLRLSDFIDEVSKDILKVQTRSDINLSKMITTANTNMRSDIKLTSMHTLEINMASNFVYFGVKQGKTVFQNTQKKKLQIFSIYSKKSPKRL